MFTGFWQCFAVIKDSDISLTRFTQLSYGNHFLYGSFFLESFPAWPFLSAGRIQAAGFSACGEFPCCSQDSGSYLLPCFSFSDKSIHFFLHSWKKSPYILLNCSENSNNFKFFYQLWFDALPWHDIFVNYLSKFFVIFVNYLSHSLLTSGIC